MPRISDVDPPKCPSCRRRLELIGRKMREGTIEADWDHYEYLIFECRGCRFYWHDHMDGNDLVLSPGSRRKKKR